MAVPGRKSRKSHRKSRAGCDACRQRHVKCDESKPSCINCITSERRCPYLTGGPLLPSDSSEPSLAGTTPAASPSNTGQSQGHHFCHLPIHTGGQRLANVELLDQWLSHTVGTCYGPRPRAALLGSIMLDTALGSPYLMHAILALSALHKSFTCALPQRIQYSDLAESLQQQGLSAFTKLGGEIDPAQAVPAFLFSWTTGLHRLCTTLADPVLHDPQAFLSAVADCIEVLRGVTTLLGQGIENLKHSALSMLTDFSSLDSARLRRESPNVAQQRIDKCTELLAEGHENDPVLSAAVKSLRNVYADFDIGEQAVTLGEMPRWMMASPPGYASRVRDRDPAALVILAHATPLLHRSRKCWAVGDAATILLDSIKAVLPQEWQEWLSWPSEALASSAGA